MISYFNSEIFVSEEKITDLHIRKSINESRILEPINKYKVIHRSILNCALDNQSNILDPRGMYGENLKILFKIFSIVINICINK